MFKGISSKQKLTSYFDSLVIGRELVQDPDVTFRLSPLETLGYDGEIACMSYDSIQSLLAVATKSGRITVYPRHGVPKCSWQIRPQQPIKHLLFKTGTACIIAIDIKETLHIFDLSNLDERNEPARLFAHSLRAKVNCLEYIPSLSHIFLGCQDGTVDTFDIDRLCVSPYRIKNLWMDQDEILRRSGVLNAPPKKRIPACCDMKTHPLDPNQLLIAYEGGIVLYNLTEKAPIRTYEYLVLPGAPGGHNDQTEGAFLERRPACTTLSWRPDAKMFAAGYDDGSFVFWATEDGDKPIMARTIDMEDVNLATSSSLFGDNAAQPSAQIGDLREPIFKLAWSGFTDNATLFDRFSSPRPEGTTSPKSKAPEGTILTILGGLLSSDPRGLHTLHLPPYLAPSLLSGSNPVQAREAFRASTRPMYKTIIPSDTPPEDFLHMTPDPYYGHAHDPYAVILMLSHDPDLPNLGPRTERGFIAYDFPRLIGKEPKELTLPVELHVTGSQAVVYSEAMSIPGFSFKRLDKDDGSSESLPLQGGTVGTNAKAPRAPLVHHAILTVHLDMSVRIWDCTTSVPTLLHTFLARTALDDRQLMAYLDGQLLVEKASSAWETTEIALALSTGEVMIFKFGYAKASAVIEQQKQDQREHYNPSPVSRVDTSQLDVEMAAAAHTMSISENERNKSSTGIFHRKKGKSSKSQRASSAPTSTSFEVDVIDNSHLSDWSTDGFKPLFALSTPSIPTKMRYVSAISLSDAGFLAVAWGERICIVDLRGPETLYAEGKDACEDGGISLLTWTVCSEGESFEKHPRLIVTYNSGLIRVFTLSFTLDTWIVNHEALSISQSSLHHPIGVFLLDPHGNSLDLNGNTLDDVLRMQEREAAGHHQSPRPDPGTLVSLLIVVSQTALIIKANLTGERLLKREFAGSKAVEAKIVRKFGTPVLVVVMNDGQTVVFSLPKCEEVKTLHLNYERARASLSCDGRILQTLSPTLFQYSTIFADQAKPAARPSYHDITRILPAAPVASYVAAATNAAAAYVSSWFSNTQSTDNATPTNSLDDILAGPNRPPPRIKPVPIAAPVQKAPVTASTSAKPPPRSSARYMGQGMTQEETIEYNKFGIPKKKRNELTDALEERGEKLDFLNENLDKASNASMEFVNQAKRFAATQGAKASLGAASGIGKGAMAGIGKMFN